MFGKGGTSGSDEFCDNEGSGEERNLQVKVMLNPIPRLEKAVEMHIGTSDDRVREQILSLQGQGATIVSDDGLMNIAIGFDTFDGFRKFMNATLSECHLLDEYGEEDKSRREIMERARDFFNQQKGKGRV